MRGPESAAQTCVVGALAGPPAAPGAEDPMVPNHAVRICFQWHVPRRPPRSGRRPSSGRTAGASAASGRRPVPLPRRARAGAGRSGSTRSAPRPRAAAAPAIAEVDAALVPAPLRLQDGDRDCAPLQLVRARPSPATPPSSRPAYACGTTCGNGSLYALQRREGRLGAWSRVADTWIR